MNLVNKIIILIFLLCISFQSFSFENKILFKVNNEIITSIDVLNEIKYLNLINNNFKKLDQYQMYEIAKNSIIKQKVKTYELKKIFTELKINESYVDEIILDYFSKLNIDSLENLKNLLNQNNLEFEKIKDKITIQVLWNQLIFNKFSNSVKINKQLIKDEINKKKKNEEFLISEIVFNIKNKQEKNKKFNQINKEIIKNGFANAAILYSISDTSINGGEIGWINQNSLSENIKNEIINTEVGQITKPIQIASGFIILKVEDKKVSTIDIDLNKEFEKIIKIKTNEQLNQFSNIYFNKIKKNAKIKEL